MRQWLAGLSERERYLVLGGALLGAYALLHLAVLAPLWGGAARMATQLPERQALLGELRAVEAEVAALRGRDPAVAREGAGQALVVIVDRTSREAGLGGALRRNQPTPDQGLRVSFEGAAFDTLVVWLTDLERRFGIGVESASFDAAGGPGLVNATLVLERRT